MANGITTERVDEQSRIGPRGEVVPVFRVTFYVDEQGPFYLELSKADFNRDNIKRLQQEVADTVRAIL